MMYGYIIKNAQLNSLRFSCYNSEDATSVQRLYRIYLIFKLKTHGTSVRRIRQKKCTKTHGALICDLKFIFLRNYKHFKTVIWVTLSSLSELILTWIICYKLRFSTLGKTMQFSQWLSKCARFLHTSVSFFHLLSLQILKKRNTNILYTNQ